MVSRSGQMRSTLQVECPHCGARATVALRYTKGETSDYEGVCLEGLEGGGTCGTSLLLTATLSEEESDNGLE